MGETKLYSETRNEGVNTAIGNWRIDLPKESGAYLVTLHIPNEGLEVNIRMFSLSGEESWADCAGWQDNECGCILGEQVMAWMKLPEPYCKR